MKCNSFRFRVLELNIEKEFIIVAIRYGYVINTRYMHIWYMQYMSLGVSVSTLHLVFFNDRALLSHNARRTMTATPSTICVWHWSKIYIYRALYTHIWRQNPMSRSVGMFFFYYFSSQFYYFIDVSWMTRWSGAPMEVAVVVMWRQCIHIVFFSLNCFVFWRKKITALHTKGKTFPWPLVILDGLILAQRAGDLFALVCVCVCVRAVQFLSV